MPKPAPYERRDKFLSRCIPMLIEEGKPPDQAAAICNSMFEEKSMKMTPEALAVLFHNTYETLAPEFGYETREETIIFDSESANGKLMIAVCAEILRVLDEGDDAEEPSMMLDMLDFLSD